MSLPDRVMTNASHVIQNISIGRFENVTNQWGGSNSTFTDAPNWGRILWEIVSVYPDFLGPIGWFIIFSIPFVMMWIGHADMVPASIVGIFFGLYIFAFVGAEFQYIGVVLIGLSIASMVWSMYMRRG